MDGQPAGWDLQPFVQQQLQRTRQIGIADMPLALSLFPDLPAAQLVGEVAEIVPQGLEPRFPQHFPVGEIRCASFSAGRKRRMPSTACPKWKGR